MLGTIARRLSVAGALAAAAFAAPAIAQKELKVGVIYDLTGPFAAGGSEAAYLGNKIAIDMINEKGGVEGYRIRPVYADAQSKAEVAISESERLLNQEKVDMLMGVFSSAHCVPMAQKADAAKKFFWMNVCVASAVLKDKKLQYAFRPQVHSDQFGEASCSFLNENSEKKMGIKPAALKVAIIYEDGPYGTGVAAGNDSACRKLGMQVVLKEGYSATAPDLSSLVTKLRRARPDVILHTGYNPDITLFLRQSKEQGLKFKALIGHGAGYGQIAKLRETFGDDTNYFFNVDPVAAQLLDPKTLKPGLGDLTNEMVKRYQAVKGPAEVPPHTSMGFNQAWIFFTDVLPRAIKKHGGIDSEALRKASLETDIPLGGTIQGYGVKFYPPGAQMAGQNERSSPVVMQYVNGRTYIAWPTPIRTTDPVLPFPKGHPFAQ
ncbi:MAG: ABC transporter substrate-binding protein [Burkholderiales bacterium]